MYFTNVNLLNEEKNKEKFQIVRYKLNNERKKKSKLWDWVHGKKQQQQKNNYTIRVLWKCNLVRPKSQNSDKKVKVYEM